MARNKEPDKLAKDMIQCKKDGFGVHYGRWKALQKPVEIKEPPLPDGWLICAYCGKPFKPSSKRLQKYCEAMCQLGAQRDRSKGQHDRYIKQWQASRERNTENK